MKRKRIFPGIDTFAERKEFAIFHLCTLVIAAPIIGALFMIIISLFDPLRNVGLPMTLETPLTNVNKWLGISLFVWNFIGSIRFYEDTRVTRGFFFARLMVLILLFGFPLFYLYNLWCIFVNNKITVE